MKPRTIRIAPLVVFAISAVAAAAMPPIPGLADRAINQPHRGGGCRTKNRHRNRGAFGRSPHAAKPEPKPMKWPRSTPYFHHPACHHHYAYKRRYL